KRQAPARPRQQLGGRRASLYAPQQLGLPGRIPQTKPDYFSEDAGDQRFLFRCKGLGLPPRAHPDARQVARRHAQGRGTGLDVLETGDALRHDGTARYRFLADLRGPATLQGCTVYQGHGRFVAEKKVAVNGSELAADHIFLNVGARATIPPIPGLDQVPYLTNSSMMDIDFLPTHLVILGGSYVGLEFAQMYRRFGSEVTVIELGPRLISREDADVSQAVADFLKDEGINVRVDSKMVGAEKQGNSIAVKVESGGKVTNVVGTNVLVATGRRPNTDDLGLDRSGIVTDAHGYIQVDDQLHTSVSGVWAMGDCNGRGAFTHTSWNDFEIVAANLLDNDQRRVSDRITAYALYTDPPLGRGGMTEAEVRKTGRPALISTLAMEDVSRAYEKGETKGFMKILVDRDSKQILGASFLGLAGDE